MNSFAINALSHMNFDALNTLSTGSIAILSLFVVTMVAFMVADYLNEYGQGIMFAHLGSTEVQNKLASADRQEQLVQAVLQMQARIQQLEARVAELEEPVTEKIVIKPRILIDDSVQGDFDFDFDYFQWEAQFEQDGVEDPGYGPNLQIVVNG